MFVRGKNATALLVAALCACDAGQQRAPAPAIAQPPAQPAHADAAVTDVIDARVIDSAVDAALPDARVQWPAEGTMTLTWVVSPPSVKRKSDPEILLAPLTLELALGTVTQRIELEPQFGALYPDNQSVCKGKDAGYPLVKNEVANITFYEGGAGGYLVRRKPADALAVVSWSQTDGACTDAKGEMVACPRGETEVDRVAIPPQVKIKQAIVEVDKRGKRRPIDCSGP